jgi:hypothetical protein
MIAQRSGCLARSGVALAQLQTAPGADAAGVFGFPKTSEVKHTSEVLDSPQLHQVADTCCTSHSDSRGRWTPRTLAGERHHSDFRSGMCRPRLRARPPPPDARKHRAFLGACMPPGKGIRMIRWSYSTHVSARTVLAACVRLLHHEGHKPCHIPLENSHSFFWASPL